MFQFLSNLFSYTVKDKDIVDFVFEILPQGNFYIDGCPVGRYMYLVATLIVVERFCSIKTKK